MLIGNRLFIFIAAGLVAIFALPVFAEGRFALVIGNDTYSSVPSLKKARNDAVSVHEALTKIGFQSTLVEDGDQLALLSALSAFSNQIQPGDQAVFYFAGHGVEIDGSNYLLPTDVPEVKPGSELIMTSRALRVETVVDTLRQKGARVSLLIIDACRDNPFPKEGTRSIGTTRGLGKVTAPEGTFLMFSAGAGQTALDRLSNDDTNPNSVFTRVLLPKLTQPGLPIHELARDVRADVRKLAQSVNHEQFPAVYDEFDGELALVPASLETAPAANDTATAGPLNSCDNARADWDILSKTDSVAALQSFVETYANCPVLTVLANERLAGLTGQAQPKASEAAGADQDQAKQDHAAFDACAKIADPNVGSVSTLKKSEIKAAIDLCRTAVDADPNGGNAGAMLGRMLYADGQYAEAFTVLTNSADAGSADGMSGLGVMYQKGRGVAKSMSDAVRLYQSAADGGSVTGAYNLGLLYEAGDGVPRDYDRAAELFVQALRGDNRWLAANAKGKPKEVIKKIQAILRDEGKYDGAVDGSFGPKTLAALEKLAGTR